MSDVITDWFLNITFEYVTRELVGADWVESTPATIMTKGVVQPTTQKDLKIMPEGAWAWESLTLHCLPDVVMEVNQFVIYDNKKYKIMAKKDWTKYGYIKYLLVEAFQAESVAQ